jgi:hypothetical protein
LERKRAGRAGFGDHRSGKDGVNRHVDAEEG